eukprot:TRINITY_DN9508_c0_g1_i1.p1 TRINITY_DN9508_c0_g1~~TRINITY_DN9508_c0_g1_i1.p1  ORF type:complete len:95 (-),score=12.71 TRINITY_DN9508_c0_g1_i1:361-645(-)
MSVYRAKKRIASTVAESQLGRKVIQHYLGPEGIVILDALKDIVTKHSSKSSSGQKLNKQFIKWCSKQNLCWNRKQLLRNLRNPSLWPGKPQTNC